MLEVPLKPNLGRGFLGVLSLDEFALFVFCVVFVLGFVLFWRFGGGMKRTNH